MTNEKVMPTIEQSGMALFDAIKTLDTLKVPFILDGGTLLGFYRDGTFAEDDHDDIDLTTSDRFAVSIPEIVKVMLGLGFEVYHEWPRNEMKHHSAQLAFKRDNAKIDIMFKEYEFDLDKVWWTVYGGRNGVTYKAVPRKLIECIGMKEITIPGLGEVEVGMPEHVEEYLAYRYGDWRTPVHRRDYSCYDTDLCIVEPNTYEAIRDRNNIRGI